MDIVCLDMEGVLVPEIWINVAERTGIEELRITTREEPDYDKLMANRIRILAQHKLKLADISKSSPPWVPWTSSASLMSSGPDPGCHSQRHIHESKP